MRLILASSSPYRAEQLARLGVPFEQIAPEVDEARRPDESPWGLAMRLAAAKARAIDVDDAALVIGSDQVAILGAQILGKPGSERAAREQLARASGRRMELLTAVALRVVGEGGGAESCHVQLEPSAVRFRRLSPAQIACYVAAEKPLDCAGAFKAEGLGIALFESVSGRDPSALIGLPMMALVHLLGRAGVDVLSDRVVRAGR